MAPLSFDLSRENFKLFEHYSPAFIPANGYLMQGYRWEIIVLDNIVPPLFSDIPFGRRNNSEIGKCNRQKNGIIGLFC